MDHKIPDVLGSSDTEDLKKCSYISLENMPTTSIYIRIFLIGDRQPQQSVLVFLQRMKLLHTNNKPGIRNLELQKSETIS